MNLTFKPMLACSTIPDLADLSYPLLASPKLDGIRCLIGDGMPFTRNMKAIPNVHIRETMASWKLHGLDGELMIPGDFNKVQSVIMSHSHPDERNFEYWCFDSFVEPKAPFKYRIGTVEETVQRAGNPRLKKVEQKWIADAEGLQRYWTKCIELGYEGVIIRDPNGPYKNGRSTPKQGWMSKLKVFHDDEAIVVDFEELMHNEDTSTKQLANMVPGNTLGALVVRWGGQVFKIGSGFDNNLRSKIWQDRTNIVGQKVTFKYQELSSYGVPRFPVFKGFRYE